jgi:hypothetical protein
MAKAGFRCPDALRVRGRDPSIALPIDERFFAAAAGGSSSSDRLFRELLHRFCARPFCCTSCVPHGYLLARWLALPPLETQAIVLLASLPVGANVYLMSRQFNTLGDPVAASLVMSTALAAATTPMILALTARG